MKKRQNRKKKELVKKTNRRKNESGENNKRGAPSVKRAMRERTPKIAKTSPNNPRRNKSGYKKTKKEVSQKQK